VAPEIHEGRKDYSFPIDVYSFGIILWELVTREEPYDEVPKDLDERVVHAASVSHTRFLSCPMLFRWCPSSSCATSSWRTATVRTSQPPCPPR
jgi:serine/threonine protein kinase